MNVINVFEEGNPSLEVHKDSRGVIADVFYNTPLHHVAIITSEPHAVRGHHYHKDATQHMLIIKGELEYWYRPFGSEDPAKMYLAKVGDLISTEPYEVHALRITEKGNEFLVFAEGQRGGKDYESDTFRVDPIF